MKQTQTNIIEPLNEKYTNKMLNKFTNNEIIHYNAITNVGWRVRKNLVTNLDNVEYKMFENFIKFYLKCRENKNMFLNLNKILPFCIDVKNNKIIFPEPVLVYKCYDSKFYDTPYMYHRFFFKYIGIPVKTLSKQETNPFEYECVCKNLFLNVLYNNKIFITTFIKSISLYSGAWENNIVIKQFDPNIVFNDKVHSYMENLYKIKQITNV